ncbi:MAG: DUF2330 domain-containing protein [Pirellulales bacterium]|nr:DUF2330 domain-containing protein [Pirellulales bacterium]
MFAKYSALAVTTVAIATLGTAWADPCGMVPPISINQDLAIERIGLQNTYVFHKDGMETFVIRPGFQGRVEDFGMLIPFPNPPAIRKVSDDIFPQIEKAVDPPEVIVNLYPPPPMATGATDDAAAVPEANFGGGGLRVDQVRVLNQEAVGMYEVAVLEAGSAAALKGWMDDHQYRFPTGMDGACEDYVQDGWCFVAVKTRVGPKSAVDPKPGMREAQPGLPVGASFDGFVQAMGFRFRSEELIVPMRLASFNAGELRNVVYILSDGPKKIRAIPEEYVVRQLAGEKLFANVTEPLPLRILGGTAKDISPRRRQSLVNRRNPTPHNGKARELFAADLLAVSRGELSHGFEEDEKLLLRIGESLNLRGPSVDRMNQDSLTAAREATLIGALDDLKNMTLTVVDGDFPREVLANSNLTFAAYQMPSRRNNQQSYDVPRHGPGTPQRDGTRVEGALGSYVPQSPNVHNAWLLGAAGLVFVLIGAMIYRGR